MSADAYAQMSVDQLIDEFVRLAQALGSVWTFWAKIPENTPERQAMDQQLRAIGAELCARKPIEKLRPLFDHENVDVRFYAAMRFLPVDPDWAIAAISAHTADLSTKDVIALGARAKKRPPARPTVRDMSTDQLVARFEDAGVRRYATRFLGGEFEPFDVELNNRIAKETREIVDELKARDALSRLLPLLDHPNISVRRTAATYAISVAPDRTLPVLESVSASRDSIEAPRASATLDRWNKNKKKDAEAPQS
jgi:HEAT repeat protein